MSQRPVAVAVAVKVNAHEDVNVNGARLWGRGERGGGREGSPPAQGGAGLVGVGDEAEREAGAPGARSAG